MTSTIKDYLFAKYKDIPGLISKRDFPMAEICSFAVGGPADIVLFPETEEALLEALQVTQKEQADLTVLGRCSNILVSDKGIRGITIIFGEHYAGVHHDDERWVCQAGLPMFQFAKRAANLGYSKAEFLYGIPGSMGGAVVMNAGAYGSSIEDIVESVRYIDETARVRTLEKKDLDLRYRHSFFSDNPGIVSEISLRLEKKDPAEIWAFIDDIQEKRKSSQPLDKKSAGSSFKRPEGAYAAKLIEEAGLKGWRKGNCGVSEKHSGFIVNYGGATASDIAEIFDYVREKVYEDSGFLLEPEVRKIGDWT